MNTKIKQEIKEMYIGRYQKMEASVLFLYRKWDVHWIYSKNLPA